MILDIVISVGINSLEKLEDTSLIFNDVLLEDMNELTQFFLGPSICQTHLLSIIEAGLVPIVHDIVQRSLKGHQVNKLANKVSIIFAHISHSVVTISLNLVSSREYLNFVVKQIERISHHKASKFTNFGHLSTIVVE